MVAMLGSLTILLTSGLLAVTLLVGQAAPPQQQIAFASGRVDRPGMYLMDADRDLTALLNTHLNIGTINDLAWSPNHQQMVFRGVYHISVDLFLLDVKSGDRRQMTGTGMNNHAPAWSPDSRLIAYTSERDRNPEIYVIDANCLQLREGCDHNARRLTTDIHTDDLAAWSPDSQRLAFQSNRDGNYEIYMIDADGRNLRQLTFNPGRDMQPAWSPDGQHIAYITTYDQNQELQIMDADGTHQQRLTFTEEHEFLPQWSPDGRQILFETTVAGSDFETYLMDTLSGRARRLTRIDMFLRNPAWWS
jgi:TolB protein